jgi:cytoskeleton protein RodZ
MSIERISGDFGKTLREARERKGVTLRQIANATKLSVGQLEALERNDLAKLPGGIFSRGIVRSYATQVGLDPEKTIQDFIAHFSHDEAIVAGHPTSEQNEDNEAFESDRRMTGTFLWLIGASVAVAAGVLYFSNVGRHPAAAVAAPSVEQARGGESQPTPPPAAAVPETTPSGASPAPGTETIPAPAPPADVPAPAVATDDQLTVVLSVKRPCFVSASVDGQRVIERLLPAGTQQTLDVKRELVLTAGDAGAIALTLNGAEAKPLGKSGEVVTARFTITNFRTFLPSR